MASGQIRVQGAEYSDHTKRVSPSDATQRGPAFHVESKHVVDDSSARSLSGPKASVSPELPKAARALPSPLPSPPVVDESARGHPIYAVSFETPLTADSVHDLKQWMTGMHSGEVNESYTAVLDQLAHARRPESRERSTGSSNTGTMSKALNFFLGSSSSSAPAAMGGAGRVVVQNPSHRIVADGKSPSPRHTLPRISMKISPPSALTATTLALLDAGYPDVRLSTHVVSFGQSTESTARAPRQPRGTLATLAGLGVSARGLLAPDDVGGDASSDATSLRRASVSGPLTGAAARLSPPAAAMADLKPCKLNVVHEQDLLVTNLSKHPANVNIRPLQAFVSDRPLDDTMPPSCFIQVVPSAFTIKKNSTVPVKVQVTLLKPAAVVEALVAVEVVGGLRLMVLIRARAERAAFGVRPQVLPCLRSNGITDIPATLALLRKALIADGGRGLRAETVFRLSPDNEEIHTLRNTLDEITFTAAVDAQEEGDTSLPTIKCSPIAAAHMVKVFLREMPNKLLSAVPTQVLLDAKSEEQCMAAVDHYLAPQFHNILMWLVKLLTDVAVFREENRMDARALAICTGPNLLDSPNDNPIAALMTSQQAVALLTKLITKELRDRGADAEIAEPTFVHVGPQSSSGGSSKSARPLPVLSDKHDF